MDNNVKIWHETHKGVVIPRLRTTYLELKKEILFLQDSVNICPLHLEKFKVYFDP